MERTHRHPLSAGGRGVGGGVSILVVMERTHRQELRYRIFCTVREFQSLL